MRAIPTLEKQDALIQPPTLITRAAMADAVRSSARSPSSSAMRSDEVDWTLLNLVVAEVEKSVGVKRCLCDLEVS